MARIGTEQAARTPVFRAVDGHSGDGFTEIEGQEVYCIADAAALAPFLMSVVSDTDLWMYLSSSGSLTAGRVNEDHAIFPYETDDKLHTHRETTGPLTLLRVERSARPAILWQPFSVIPFAPQIRRKIYKSVRGDSVTFEETDEALELTFRYRWAATDEWGFIRTCTLINHDLHHACDVELLDGVSNVLPAGVDLRTQQRSSCLVNAYSRCEIDPKTGLGIFAMTSLITDRAEPSESLHANVAWSHGLDSPTILLSADQLPDFRAGRGVRAESILKGRRGAYFVSSRLRLPAGGRRPWQVILDAHRDQPAVAALQSALSDADSIEARLARSMRSAEQNLTKLLASADGIQQTADKTATSHHLANVLFNCMRGGVIVNNGEVATADFEQFMRQRNRAAYEAHRKSIAELPAQVAHRDLIAWADRPGDPNLIRIALEYLPITFSRRHGDPSRPWNRFSIRVRKDDGSPAMNYQGNWRDIFQNWDALCMSFPAFLPSMVAKFVNASTVDGFNPYRVTRGGIEWEEPDPEDPWSNIGYWGDHQIIYLLRFLEASDRFDGSRVPQLLGRRLFAYADVPYRLKPYPAILRDRWNTIRYDSVAAKRIEQRVRALGGDGKLVLARDGSVYHVTLLEKLLVAALSKLSNLVLGGGIWMNTQRPEWNDANNALVGNGLSMVTLCYLRRYVRFLADRLDQTDQLEIEVSNEVVDWFERIAIVLEKNEALIDSDAISDHDRKRLLDELATPFSDYRAQVYTNGFSGFRAIAVKAIATVLRRAQRFLNHSIRANRRDDGLYHSYNLLRLSNDTREIRVERLDPMLEGQVAVLSSGALSAGECLEVTRSLFVSRLYRPDQKSFMLYPDRELPAFLEKNRLDLADVQANPLLTKLLAERDGAILSRDVAGQVRFKSSFRHAGDLTAALDRLRASEKWAGLVNAHRDDVMARYERVFQHASFTGRSGAMFGYEGLGCIYWHMVAKLLLAVQECYFRAIAANEEQAVTAALAEQYYRIRAGLGFNKTAREYGAFPTDPYSHTPKHAGAQQPGMTGQVKEEILTRMGELGVRVEDGSVRFSPTLLRRREFLKSETEWSYFDVAGREQKTILRGGTIGFTFCQVPVVYELTRDQCSVSANWDDGSETVIAGDRLPARIALAITARTGRVVQLEVKLSEGTLQ